ncbi:unnamed protein product [Dovyalis caffra]|uniref:TOD1/MUCI70 glycosyltransferase-like domain-containing protein n=1 Tax=Dovyalis caffra TaxID=77055 RepID=A0AAV1RR35_9ROSI|nr:unnamed protein product [Dovyalis caffra]
MDEEPVRDGFNQSSSLFGGHLSWTKREESFKLNSSMKVQCGFMRNGGGEMDPVDIEYAKKCRFVVVSAIFGQNDVPRQPSSLSHRSKKRFCFLMVVDEVSLNFIEENNFVRQDYNGGRWIGIWRLVLLKHPPYDDPSRNEKVPKILTHRLFPQAQYSIWIDGKIELMADPLQLLDRYLWVGKNTFAIAEHKCHPSIYDEAEHIKLQKRYARPFIDLQMKIYYYEGMKPWSSKNTTISGKNKNINFEFK